MPIGRGSSGVSRSTGRTPKAVAVACDYEYSGTFRETVKALADAGEVVRTADGKLSIDRRHAGAGA